MNRPVSVIIDELAVAACEQDIDPDTLAAMVLEAATETDVSESGESE